MPDATLWYIHRAWTGSAPAHGQLKWKGYTGRYGCLCPEYQKRLTNTITLYFDDEGHLIKVDKDDSEEWNIHEPAAGKHGVEIKMIAPGDCTAAGSSSGTGGGECINPYRINPNVEDWNECLCDLDCRVYVVKLTFDEEGHWRKATACLDESQEASTTLHSLDSATYGFSQNLLEYNTPDAGAQVCEEDTPTWLFREFQWDEEGHLRRVVEAGSCGCTRFKLSACDSGQRVEVPCCPCVPVCTTLDVALEFTCDKTGTPTAYSGTGTLTWNASTRKWTGNVSMGCVGTIGISLECIDTGDPSPCNWSWEVIATQGEQSPSADQVEGPCCVFSLTADWTGFDPPDEACGCDAGTGVLEAIIDEKY